VDWLLCRGRGRGRSYSWSLISHPLTWLGRLCLLGGGVRLGMHACRRALEPEQRLMLQGLLYFLL
jgi:hypothetical protein